MPGDGDRTRDKFLSLDKIEIRQQINNVDAKNVGSRACIYIVNIIVHSTCVSTFLRLMVKLFQIMYIPWLGNGLASKSSR